MRHVVYLSVFMLAVLGICISGAKCSRDTITARFEHEPAIRSHVYHSVQEIDGCDYIVYDTGSGGYGRRLIHKGNCPNHGLARELKEQF